MVRWAAFLSGMAIAFAGARIGQADYYGASADMLIGVIFGLRAILGDQPSGTPSDTLGEKAGG